MRLATWTAALRQEFCLPAALSVALHGLVGFALGAFTLSTPVMPTQPQELKVDLVSLESAPPARQTAPSRTAQPVHVRTFAPRNPTQPAPGRSVASSAALAPAAPNQPVGQAAEPAPSLRDLPLVLAPAAPPAAAFPDTVAFSAPEPAEPPPSLSGSTEAVSLSRPLTIATSGSARLLRDTTAEAASIRSKVRFGYNPRPEYPLAAREAGWEGTTVLQIVVLLDGTVGSLTLQKTSGYAVLDEAALTTVKTWRFIPARDGNFPIKSVVRLPIRFDLKEAD